MDRIIDPETRQLIIDLLVGGVLACYVRQLFLRFGRTVSGADSVSSTFPLLTLVTICVISVVKASLALSLGLVGALSIVRFRAAIKEPEELVYLFLCIAIGVSLGAGHLAASVTLVLVVTVFVLARAALDRGPRRHTLLLTVSGPAAGFFDEPEGGVLAALREAVVDEFTVQRLEVEDDHGLLRAILHRRPAEESERIIADLRRRLPGCRLSYVDMDTVL